MKDKAKEGPMIKCPNFNLIQKTWEALKGCKAGFDMIKFAFQTDYLGML